MKVRAPGKLVLTGAYAVLEGAPAIVVAVDRYAHADATKPAESPTRELVEAFGEGKAAPSFDASALYAEDGETKLGLGSSAAVLVASIAASMAALGKDLEDPDVRSLVFTRARDAHARAQGGGSGIDVAASTYGGVLRYSLFAGRPSIAKTRLPEKISIAAWFSGGAARTSDLLAQVRAFREASATAYESAMAELGSAAELAAEHAGEGTAEQFIAAVRSFAVALDRLGDQADAPIVPLAFRRLDVAAADEGGVFLPSGAGGGDVGVFIGTAAPTENFSKRASVLGMQPLTIDIDRTGIRIIP